MASAPDPPHDEREERRRAVLKAARGYEVRQSPAWNALLQISPNLELDDIEVDPAGIFFTDDRFKGVMNLYVLLRFGSGPETVETAESFPGFFEGRFEANGEAVIERLDVKTASFYA